MSNAALVRRAHHIARTSPRSRPVRRRPARAVRRPVRRGRSGSSSNVWIWFAVAVGIVLALISSTGAAASPAATSAGGPGAATAYTGVATGCVMHDPTTSGCVTGATEHALTEIDRVFGGYRKGPKIRSAGCWDAHAWNPTSDHPLGKACDLFFAPAGTFAAGDDLAHGWELANWLRANAAALRVKYVIWQGRIWQADTNRDSGGWGTKYTGGGIYDMKTATGSHSDHVHVSIAI